MPTGVSMKNIVIALALALSVGVGAATSQTTINELMRDIGDTMLRMLPALYREESDRVLLLENLVRLDYLFEQARPHIEDQPVGARVTYGLLNSRIDEAIALGDRRNLSLLRRSVSDAFELCASCHAQDGMSKRAFGVSRIRELDEYLAAEFSYLTRDYESALTSIDNYFDSGRERTQVRDNLVLERLLAITGEIYADPALAAAELRSVAPRISDRTRLRVTDWIDTFERLAESGKGGLQSPLGQGSIAGLDRFLTREWPSIRSTLGIDAQEAYWVTIRGALQRMLAQYPESAEVPRLLYWLAVSDRALHYRFYNSLSRAYLERCIIDFTDHPYARECVDEYEFLVLVSFSGSGGTLVPDDVRERLAELRALVYRD